MYNIGMKNIGMVKKTLYFTRTQLNKLDKLSKEREVTVSQIIREFVNDGLNKDERLRQ